MPFERAAQLLSWLTGATVTEPTARRLGLRAGAVYVAHQEAEALRIAREFPPPPPGPAKLVLEVDGAMVPLVGGEWTEVKTLVIGTVSEPVLEAGEWVVHGQGLSYFSRNSDAERFGQQALVEVHRRGVERAPTVAAVTDGAEWEQGFIDLHRADAVRILDFPHAAQRLPLIAQAIGESDPAAASRWGAERAQQLKEEGPAPLLAELAQLARRHPEAAGLGEHQAYLQKRQAHMQYPAYRARGLPLGSGAVESGNKLVVQARLKGAGMHWARGHVDPMLALRNVVCSDRWEEAWPQMAARLQLRAAAGRPSRGGVAVSAVSPAAPASPAALPSGPAAPRPAPALEPGGSDAPANDAASRRRPAANHPWRRYAHRWPGGEPLPASQAARS
jgi:hypothetical protein